MVHDDFKASYKCEKILPYYGKFRIFGNRRNKTNRNCIEP